MKQSTVHTGMAYRLLAVWLLLFIAYSVPAAEQASQTSTVVNSQVLQSKIKEVEATASLDEATKKKLTEYYHRALTNLDKQRSYNEDAASFSQARKTAPVEASKLRNELASRNKIKPENTLRISKSTTLPELEQLLQKEKADLAAVEAKLSDLKKRLEVQATRPSAARERLLVANRELDAVSAERKEPAVPGELAALTQARGWSLETRSHALSAEIKMLDQELLSYDERKRLLEAEQDRAEYSVKFVTTRVRLLEDLISKRRLAEAEQVQQQAEALQEQFKQKHALVRELAEKNVALGEELGIRALELERIAAKDDYVRATGKRINDELSTVRQKLEIAGLSQAMGRVLMQQRRSLPELSVMKVETEEREQFIASSGLRQIQYREESRDLRDINAYVSQLAENLPADEFAEIRPELEELANNRLELLNKAIATEASFLRALGELDLAQRQLIEVVTDYQEFLGRRLLWIRSTNPVSFSQFAEFPEEVASLLSPVDWLITVRTLFRQLVDTPVHGLLLLVLIVLVLLRWVFINKAVATADRIRRIRTDSYTHTFAALGWTVLASVSIPLLFMAIGWVLSQADEITAFTSGVASGLLRVGSDYLVLLFFADVCITGGLANKHFNWSAEIVAKLRRELRLLMAIFLPSAFIAYHSLGQGRTDFEGSLFTFVVLLAIFSIAMFEYRIFTPHGGVIADFLRKHPRRLLARLYPVWISLLIGITIGLIVLVFNGYLYTGGTLTRYFIDTMWFIFALVLVSAMVTRWLLLISRRLSLKNMLERRQETRAAREAQAAGEAPASSDDDIIDFEEPEVDVAALGAHSRKLLRISMIFAGIIGMWLIWSPVLPALAILDNITLWHHMATVEGVDKLVAVNLTDLILAVIVAVVTITAASGLPAFLEILLLQHSTITTGGRYTATTLLRYVIVGVGTILFFSILGASWSQIQWLVAALGVGIGFGLQEIVANFISGLIILFERPIRVGDTVTVGDTTGVVSKIKIRATTITNWDRQELLVPNKEFITTRLLNWSLSDPIIRVVIPVGIAYGSDVSKAMELMKQAAIEHNIVLDEPAPSVTFESFGDNSLQLYLRAFLPSMEHRITTITDLHEAINRKFNESGIVIAFPQRDVHLDSSQPIDVRIRQEHIPDSGN